MRIEGRTFIVTGGASGLGEATVRAIVAAGGNAVAADIQREKGEALAAELGDRALFSHTDVADESSVQATVDAAGERFGALGGAVSCAGIADPAKILSSRGNHTLEHFERVVRVNLTGTFNVLRLVAARLQESEADDNGERGVVINTASIAALEGQIGQAAYASSKAGVVGLALPAARELARYGIRVVTIAPGLFETPLLESLPDEARVSLGKQVPFPSRLGRPQEFADLVGHIITNPMLNGEVIRLDGAIRMAPR